MSLCVVPLSLVRANAFVREMHRHNGPLPGCLFAIGVEAEPGRLVGVAIVGHPAARMLGDGRTAEIRRVCTDGTFNACSVLYGACRRAARAMGYVRIYTYTLPDEGGASLRGAGFRLDTVAGDASCKWGSRAGRKAVPIGDDLFGGKWRWIA